MKTSLSKEDKEKVNKEVLDIIMFHLKVLQMEPTKENIKLATTMFVEGVKYWEEQTK
jgi:hypothetical protein